MNNAAKMVTESQAFEALRLAQLHEHEGLLASSAKVAAADAACCFNAGDYTSCVARARESLRYSVGVFHKHYDAVGR
jgi:hypothetical protein